ncbi:MAG: hypothetical protein COY58_00570 [Gammaproteobacteria bacterium CG_4_10_14_0_8_um_filter_38_16]|nr:MAG: hypothetical protein COY58_00570 [Gammaproteobacteria bacterium CG_4_10_14_0_8_um_filter_38_16]PJA04252.1 MAG: hypothetical protein COX72_01370 [Gammaproteobacteria bacterium CG_4_10_14_0_2_um_filter_38_22]PJB10920.1 MAG: hypothetical protein CO120_02255 [Gammaproteobacteria bacterium CG_4_9_14_3_um_filter_38_9]
MTKISSHFFKECEKTVNDCFSIEENFSPAESISWFSKIARKENASLNEVNNALKKIEYFVDQKEFEKEETVAELQLGYGFQKLLEEKRSELNMLAALKNNRKYKITRQL